MVSVHCQKRMQQRSIGADVLEVLLDYGTWVRSHRAYRVYLCKAGLAAFRRDCGERAWREIESKLGIYAIVSYAGTLVTCGHRTRRFRHP